MKNAFPGLVFAALTWLGMMQSVAANDIAGAADEDFQRAIQIWLNDDDAQSLPMLASLAQSGNRAARLLLARIEFTDRAPSAFVLGLERKARDDIYRGRRPGSRFRPSWIRLEAENGDAFAADLRRAGELGLNIETVRRLRARGEIEAAEHQIRKLAVDGSEAERAQLAELIGPADELAPYLRGFRFARDGLTTGHTAMQSIIGQLTGENPTAVELAADVDTRRALIYVDIGYQAGRRVADYDASGRHFETLSRWLLQAPVASPLARLCRRSCSEAELATCALTAFGLVGGYYEILRFDSPLETLISQPRFLSSTRAEGMMRRRIAAARSEAAVPVFEAGALRRRSACLAGVIAAP